MIKLAPLISIKLSQAKCNVCRLGSCIVDEWDNNGSGGIVCTRGFVFEGISIVPGDDTEIGNIELDYSRLQT